MRKLLWCCSTAGVLAAGGLFSTAFYGYCHPDSAVGQCLRTAADASIALQPIGSVASMAARVSQSSANPQETATAGDAEACIPDDPQPIEPEETNAKAMPLVLNEKNIETTTAAPIVIPEEAPAAATPIEVGALPRAAEVPDNICPLVMPYCTDDDDAPSTPKPVMPLAEEDSKPATKNAHAGSKESFKEWMKLYESSSEESSVEMLPPPHEEPNGESKCQEDIHLHEHYPGCPSTTCPYSGKSYPAAPATKKGAEESSEEPPIHHRVGKSSLLEKKKDGNHPTEGVDTMEYRPSDGGLNEYGRGPL